MTGVVVSIAKSTSNAEQHNTWDRGRAWMPAWYFTAIPRRSQMQQAGTELVQHHSALHHDPQKWREKKIMSGKRHRKTRG